MRLKRKIRCSTQEIKVPVNIGAARLGQQRAQIKMGELLPALPIPESWRNMKRVTYPSSRVVHCRTRSGCGLPLPVKEVL